jgi:hypothetical protein
LNLVLRELDKSWKNWGKIGFLYTTVNPTLLFPSPMVSIINGLTGE